MTTLNSLDALEIVMNLTNQLLKSQNLPLEEHNDIKNASKSFNKILTTLSKGNHRVIILIDGVDGIFVKNKSERVRSSFRYHLHNTQ